MITIVASCVTFLYRLKNAEYINIITHITTILSLYVQCKIHAYYTYVSLLVVLWIADWSGQNSRHMCVEWQPTWTMTNHKRFYFYMIFYAFSLKKRILCKIKTFTLYSTPHTPHLYKILCRSLAKICGQYYMISYTFICTLFCCWCRCPLSWISKYQIECNHQFLAKALFS